MKSVSAPIWTSDTASAGLRPLWMIALAVVSITAWQGVEHLVSNLPHPKAEQLHIAARLAKAAQAEIAQAKQKRELMQPADIDPNRTGLIGPDWSETTTTIGEVQSKRTTTNPDLAAVIARSLLSMNPPPGAAVVIVASGSFPGANIAAISAVETLGLKPVIVSSLGSSMFGANDPEFGWLDMETAIRNAGIWHARTTAVVLGGESATAESLTGTGREMLTRTARRNGYEPIVADDLAELKRGVMKALSDAAPEGSVALINVGGSVLGIGTCLDAYGLPNGLIRKKLPCDRGVTGLIHDFAARNVPVLHILYIKRLALDWGLPYDPVPLPPIGANPRIYGRLPLSPDIQ
jgi:poly-gamma-glutamate system protein